MAVSTHQKIKLVKLKKVIFFTFLSSNITKENTYFAKVT